MPSCNLPVGRGLFQHSAQREVPFWIPFLHTAPANINKCQPHQHGPSTPSTPSALGCGIKFLPGSQVDLALACQPTRWLSVGLAHAAPSGLTIRQINFSGSLCTQQGERSGSRALDLGRGGSGGLSVHSGQQSSHHGPLGGCTRKYCFLLALPGTHKITVHPSLLYIL